MDIHSFIAYWNSFLNAWRTNPNSQFNVYCTQVGITNPSSALKSYCQYMPEPYYGNPEECSAVILNLNPSISTKPTSSSHLLLSNNSFAKYAAKSYYAYASPFTFKTAGGIHKDAIEWWDDRKNWLNRLTKIAGIDYQFEPFGVEICPWHSENFSDISTITQGSSFYSYIDDKVIEPAMLAVKDSAFPFAFAVGAVFQNILKKLRFKECGYWHQEAWQNFIMIPQWYDANRKYKLFRRLNSKENYYDYILVTWTHTGHKGANVPPNSSMFPVERYIINQLI